MTSTLLLAQSLDDCGSVCEWVFDVTENEPVARLLGAALEPIGKIAVVLILAVVARGIARRAIDALIEQMKAGRPYSLSKLSEAVEGRRGNGRARLERRAESMGALLRSGANVVIWTLSILTILGAFDINLAPLIAGAGIVGIALGFGAQDLVKDFLSGVFMLIEDQFGVGDTVDVGEATGTVEGISLRTTRIRDVRGSLWHVPNGEIRRVGNHSQEWARALLDVGVAYGTDIDRAIAVIQAAGSSVYDDPDWSPVLMEEPEVWGVESLGADAVAIRIVLKTVPGEQYKVMRALRRRIKYALDEAGIEIPFAQRTMWLRTEDGDAPSIEVTSG